MGTVRVNSNKGHFQHRADAGRQLAELLDPAVADDAVVLGLPRGGVPVGSEVARVLGVPLDVVVVRKLGVPGHEELAMGAIASGGVRVLNEQVLAMARVDDVALESVTERERRELERRERAYRGDRPPATIAGRHAIVVDDGLATGATMRAAVTALRLGGPRRITVAVPVGSEEALRTVADLADEVVCVIVPPSFRAVGEWYADFSPTTDDEVRAALRPRAQSEGAADTFPPGV